MDITEDAGAFVHSDATIWHNYYITKGALPVVKHRSKYHHTSIEYLGRKSGTLVSCVMVLDRDGPWSITNDAERVCRELHAFYESRLLNNRTFRIIYRDTCGEWSELLHQDGKFLGYADLDDLGRSLVQSMLRAGNVPE